MYNGDISLNSAALGEKQYRRSFQTRVLLTHAWCPCSGTVVIGAGFVYFSFAVFSDSIVVGREG